MTGTKTHRIFEDITINGVKISGSNPELTADEAYALVGFYVKRVFNSFSYIKMNCTVEDAIQDVSLKLIRLNMLNKYDASVTSKKYFIARSVQTTLISINDYYKRRFTYSLDYEIDSSDDNETTLLDLIPGSFSPEAEHNNLLDFLPTNVINPVVASTIEGVDFSYNHLARLLGAGYIPQEIANLFINTKTGLPITSSTVNRAIRMMRDLIRVGYMSE